MGATFSQPFPPRARLIEQNLSSQKGKVFIVTGGYSGLGYQLITILYQAGGKVYIARRSEAKARQCIKEIQSVVHITPTVGQREYLPLELDDLNSIKASASAFQTKEPRLEILWNNAGVSLQPLGHVSKQGHELQVATNCHGPFLFAHSLPPSLQAAAPDSPGSSVRIIWTSSQTIELNALKGGLIIADLTCLPKDQTKTYVASKTDH